jgi:hypothetical protein
MLLLLLLVKLLLWIYSHSKPANVQEHLQIMICCCSGFLGLR